MNVVDRAKELFRSKEPERVTELVSLLPWNDDLEFVQTELELNQLYEEFQHNLSKSFGAPTHSGVEPRHGNPPVSPNYYVEEYESALRATWWEQDYCELMLFITGHDAGSLQFIRLSVSDIELDRLAYQDVASKSDHSQVRGQNHQD